MKEDPRSARVRTGLQQEDPAARLAVFWQFFGTLLRADSAFEHTMRMTDIRAYDALGVDVTSTAFAGFESVPEPGTSWALGSGVAMMVAVARRKISVNRAMARARRRRDVP